MAAVPDQARPVTTPPAVAPVGRRAPRWWLRPAGATAVIAALVAANQIASSVHAGVSVSPAVSEQLDAQGSADVVVSLPFDAEQFHASFFQACCAVAQVDGNRYFLQDATPAQIDHVARQHWVSEVNLWETR